MPVAVLLTVAGFQVPVIAGALVDDAGNVGAAPFAQIAVNGANVGVTFGVTVCTNVVVAAHTPAAGVNV